MKNKTVRLTESAIMLALATVLSILPILDLPYGGSITLCSMLPICIIAYRHGVPWGLFTGAVYGLLQMFLGMKNVMYFTTPLSVIAVILLDYILAFTAIGLTGIFKPVVKKQSAAMACGAFIACLVRYLFHVVAGATVWAGLSIPSGAALAYSLAYNATYMLPETVVLLLGVSLIAGVLDFRNAHISRITGENGTFDWLTAASGLSVVATLILDVRLIFTALQDADTGEFIITGLAQVDWMSVGIITAIGAALTTMFVVIRRLKK